MHPVGKCGIDGTCEILWPILKLICWVFEMNAENKSLWPFGEGKCWGYSKKEKDVGYTRLGWEESGK